MNLMLDQSFVKRSFPIEPNDNLESLINKVKEIENNIYPKTVSEYLT